MSNNIPSDEDFARAERLDRERSRNLDKVNKNTEQHFKKRYPIDYIYIMPQGNAEFRAYIFFEKEKDLKETISSGSLQHTKEEVWLFSKGKIEGIRTLKVSDTLQEFIDFIYAEIERQGRGKRGSIKIVFELDSHENVVANYDGNYFFRLQ